MQQRRLKTALCALLLGTAVACDQADGCEEAKHAIEPMVKQVCQELPYVNSPFCGCCVANGFYSVDNDCGCRALALDTGACFYATDDQARPQVRAAIEFANAICSVRKPVLPWASDAGESCRIPSAEAASVGGGSMPEATDDAAP